MLSPGSPTRPLSLDEFRASLAALARFETAPFLAVAVSGGPDSLALAILADRWARERAGEICALTVDHCLRRESSAEIRQLATWLSVRGIQHEVLVWTGEKPKAGIQEAARVARYRLLAGWCREHDCLHLLTAHHQEDQIETHLIRRRAHSGADGLAAMSAIRELDGCRLLRPLLGFAKDRLVAFLRAERQPFLTDPSNLNPAFERSRYRGGDGAIASGVDLLGEIRTLGTRRAAREHGANALLARYVSLHPAGFALLDPKVVSATSHELAERLLSAVATSISGISYAPRREQIARLRDVLAADGPRGHTVGGCRFIHWRDHILVARELAAAARPIRLNPGDDTIWDRRFKVVVPSTASAFLAVGYLGPAGVAQLCQLPLRLRRGCPPRLLLPIFPVIWDENGIAAVPHLGYRRERIGALPRIVFRPVNTLTPAGFAVV